MTRLHPFNRSSYRLWADRVPVVHGRANLFTLWRKDGPKWKRLIGGVQAPALRAFIRELAA